MSVSVTRTATGTRWKNLCGYVHASVYKLENRASLYYSLLGVSLVEQYGRERAYLVLSAFEIAE